MGGDPSVGDEGGRDALSFCPSPKNGEFGTAVNVPVLGLTDSLAIEPSGRFLYAMDISAGGVSVYTIDQSNGAVAFTAGPYCNYCSNITSGGIGQSILIDPTGHFLYVIDESGGPAYVAAIAGFSINPQTGALTPLSNPVGYAGFQGRTGAIDPTGNFLYVPGYTSPYTNQTATYGFNITTGGLLTPLLNSPYLNTALARIEPSGKFGFGSYLPVAAYDTSPLP